MTESRAAAEVRPGAATAAGTGPAGELPALHGRVAARFAEGDAAGIDVEIEAAAAAGLAQRPELSWEVPLWRGARALLGARLDRCQAHLEQAEARGREAADPTAAERCAAQRFALRLAQDRVLELEAPARAAVARRPGAADARARLALVLGRLGRDGEARAELARLAPERFAAVADDATRLPTLALLAELVTLVGAELDAVVLYDLLLGHARRFVVDEGAAACHGSASHHLGLLAHTLGRWERADAHFAAALEDNQRAGAPLLAAHTRAQWSALLRARDRGGDWQAALDLLAGAEKVYRRLGADRPADEARAVLARSQEPPAGTAGGGTRTVRRRGEGWAVGYDGVEVLLDDSAGMGDLWLLVANPGRSFHVTELVWGRGSRAAAGGAGDPILVDAPTRALYRRRAADLQREQAGAAAAGDAVGAALARAELDLLETDLAGGPPPAAAADPVERARRAVGTRIRLGIDAVAAVHPSLGHHLRHSVRTGQFCSYQPQVPAHWSVEPG